MISENIMEIWLVTYEISKYDVMEIWLVKTYSITFSSMHEVYNLHF